VNRRPADNPFSSRRVDDLSFRFTHLDWTGLLDALALNNGRGAVVGPHGSGKTTLLEQLASRIEGEPVWIRLDADTANAVAAALTTLPSAVNPGHAVFLDGAEQLRPWGWWGLLRRAKCAGTLVITSHRPGRLPTIYECTTDPELLEELVRELAPGAFESTDIDALFHRHGGNIRLCFRELYDRWTGR
jgi:hypothetical protein